MWQKFIASFHDSEVLLWARVQVAIGAALVVLEVISAVDLSGLFKDHSDWVVYYMVANALITEWLRRRRKGFGPDEDLKVGEPK